jgi:hypothetical protein
LSPEPPSAFNFLILGAGRGGTSLLAGLLDQHSGVEVGFELFSIDCLMGQGLQTHGEDSMIAQRVQAFRSACQQEALRFPGKLWGNKITTEQLAGLEDHKLANPTDPVRIVDYFFHQGLPDVKIVFILRDGRTCVRSKINRTGQSVELACARWNFSVDVYRFLQTRHSNTICLKYEDLLAQPMACLEAVCAFLGLAYEPGMLSGTDNAKMLPDYRQPGLDTSKLHLDNIPDGIDRLIAENLAYCGYR